MRWSRARPAPRSGASWGVPALIKLGKQAREDGAKLSDNVVGDVVEALIGALLLDGGLEAAERLRPGELGALSRRARRRRRSIPSRCFRNWRRRAGSRHPVYEVVGRSARTMPPTFTGSRSASAKRRRSRGGRASKQEAETAAAAALLEKIC
jgi:ribonuclease-3